LVGITDTAFCCFSKEAERAAALMQFKNSGQAIDF